VTVYCTVRESGSLVGIDTWNRCGPSIPACMLVVNVTVVLWPGLRVVEPTTG
jgi:hypothetical protein